MHIAFLSGAALLLPLVQSRVGICHFCQSYMKPASSNASSRSPVESFARCLHTVTDKKKFPFRSCCVLRQAKKKYLEQNVNANNLYRFVRVVKFIRENGNTVQITL